MYEHKSCIESSVPRRGVSFRLYWLVRVLEGLLMYACLRLSSCLQEILMSPAVWLIYMWIPCWTSALSQLGISRGPVRWKRSKQPTDGIPTNTPRGNRLWYFEYYTSMHGVEVSSISQRSSYYTWGIPAAFGSSKSQDLTRILGRFLKRPA